MTSVVGSQYVANNNISVFLTLAKFRQKSQLKVKILRKKRFRKFSVAKNERGKEVKIAIFLFMFCIF
jgi:hypothetical protein